ncbi:MAG: cupin domain-containing protein [Caldilineaceae bacterium]|nr:cupin domain-containing protein [Caldilineaceae bacterium]
MSDQQTAPPVRAYGGDGTWASTEVRPYKEDGTIFKAVTRQNLFDTPELACQWRYFEVGPGGHSTLERHEHVHAVMVVRGEGRVLVGDAIYPLELHDLVYIPSLTWHQFRAGDDEPLGFLCLVNHERDRPQLPDAEALTHLREDEEIGAFIRC